MTFFNEHDIDFTVINTAFPNLLSSEIAIIKQYVYNIINHLAFRFNFNPVDKDIYSNQFRKNKGRDIIAIVLMLIPYITEPFNKVVSLEQLWKNTILTNRQIDLGETLSVKEYINENYKLLKRSIDMTSNKLYVNWITTRPVDVLNYKELISYQKLKSWNGSDENTGIYIGDIYNSIVNDLYLNVKKHKWLLYELVENGQIVSYENILQEINSFTFDTLIAFFQTRQNPYKYSASSIINFIKYALVFFENYYPIKKLIKEKKYLPFQIVDLLELEEDRKDDIDIEKITTEELSEKLLILGEELWKSYIDDTLRSFNYTWYAKKPHVLWEVITPEDTVISEKLYLTRKNVYHFAKGIFHKSRNNWIPNKKLWEELSYESQQDLLRTKLIYNYNFTDWFSVGSHLRRIYANNDSKSRNKEEKKLPNYYAIISSYLLKSIYEYLSEIIHESLIYKGVLSVYTPNLTINLESNFSIKENIFNILSKDYSSHYYYLTGDLFDKEYLNSIKYKPDENNWFYTYAMDWLAQINFFHHMLCNRVCFVTGSTGVGKSTQAPKLILYGYRMLFYNNDVKILCSQPRIAPTVGNANRISKELGTPIDKENKNNFYVQYQYSDDKHVPLDFFTTSYLRIMTDGSLLENIKSNISLYEHYFKGNTKYIRPDAKNLYDVIIVDEAHEHNKNMDLILTVVKKSMSINKSIKLFIISATMDDDELRYRSYYKEVYDNYQFPNFTLQSNCLNIVDRRIHISPYGKTTRFSIKEYFEEIEPVDYKAAENIGILKVLEITRKFNTGEVLFFSVGEKEIKHITKILNEQLPPDTIALPFYSNLPNTYKDIFGNLRNNLSKIYYQRKYLITILETHSDLWTSTTLPYGRISNSYKRAVIIATNVAEASITISSLKFVVDTGYNKVSIFDHLSGGIQIQLLKISESSRLQRKGRVGRVSSGFVYYIYKKNSRRDILTQYKITIEMVYDTVISLLSNNNLISDAYYEEYLKIYTEENKKIIFPNVAEKTDFLINLELLMDKSYTFYLIHPNENLVKREIQPKVTLLSDKEQDFSLFFINNIIVKNKVYTKLFFDEKNLNIINTLQMEVSISQFTIFNFVSLIVAYKYGFDIFYKIAWLLFNTKVEMLPIELVSLDKLETNKVFFNKDPEVGILTLNLPERISKLHYLFYTFGKNIQLTIEEQVISTKDKVFFSLYFSNPLNIVYYNNGYKNKFSNVTLEVNNSTSKMLGYLTAISGTVYNSFNLNL